MPLVEFLPEASNTTRLVLVGEQAVVQAELAYLVTKLLGAAAAKIVTPAHATAAISDLYTRPDAPYVTFPVSKQTLVQALAIEDSSTKWALMDQTIERAASGAIGPRQCIEECTWLAEYEDEEMIFLNREGQEVRNLGMRLLTDNNPADMAQLDTIPGLDKAGINAYAEQYELVTNEEGHPMLQSNRSHQVFGTLDGEGGFTQAMILLNEAHPAFGGPRTSV